MTLALIIMATTDEGEGKKEGAEERWQVEAISARVMIMREDCIVIAMLVMIVVIIVLGAIIATVAIIIMVTFAPKNPENRTRYGRARVPYLQLISQKYTTLPTIHKSTDACSRVHAYM